MSSSPAVALPLLCQLFSLFKGKIQLKISILDNQMLPLMSGFWKENLVKTYDGKKWCGFSHNLFLLLIIQLFIHLYLTDGHLLHSHGLDVDHSIRSPTRRMKGIPCLPTSSVKYVHLLASVLPPCGMTQRAFFIAHDIN